MGRRRIVPPVASAPPLSRPRSILRILASVIPFAVVLAALAVSFLSVTCLDCGGFPPPRPSVTFDDPEPIADGFAFGVAAVSRLESASRYQVLLRVNESGGTAVGLSSNMTFTVGGLTYAVVWIDSGGEGLLTVADRFLVTRAGGFLPSTQHTFLLLWTDGSIIRALTYRTP